MVGGLELAIPGQQITKQGVRFPGGVKAALERGCAPAHRIGGSGAVFPDDVGVGKSGEKAEIDGERHPLRMGPTPRCDIEFGQSAVENICKTSRKLMRDAVAL